MNISFAKLIGDSKKLAMAVKSSKKKYFAVYGVPSGGILPAYIVSQELGIPLLGANDDFHRDNTILVVDDLVDSGNTLSKWPLCDSAVLYRKSYSPKTTYVVENVGDVWLKLPHEKDDEDVEVNITRIIEHIGENPVREGLIDTPKRVAKMYKEIFRGYDEEQKPAVTIFDNGTDGISYDEMIVDTGDYYSHCEHHMVPFFGQYWFAYVPHPKGKILGLSKVARVVDYFAARLQVQERLTADIVTYLEEALLHEKYPPLGIALIMKGEHLCKTMRGAKKKGQMTTSVLRGVFKEQAQTRQEFLALIK